MSQSSSKSYRVIPYLPPDPSTLTPVRFPFRTDWSWVRIQDLGTALPQTSISVHYPVGDIYFVMDYHSPTGFTTVELLAHVYTTALAGASHYIRQRHPTIYESVGETGLDDYVRDNMLGDQCIDVGDSSYHVAYSGNKIYIDYDS